MKASEIKSLEEGMQFYSMVCRWIMYQYRIRDEIIRLKKFRAYIRIMDPMDDACEDGGQCKCFERGYTDYDVGKCIEYRNPWDLNEYSIKWCHRCRAVYKITKRIKRRSYQIRNIPLRIRAMLEIKSNLKIKWDDSKYWNVQPYFPVQSIVEDDRP